MKITKKRLAAILQRQDQLTDLAREFANYIHPEGRHGECRVNSSGYVEEYINTSCYCHPEYEWVDRGTPDQFQEWLENHP